MLPNRRDARRLFAEMRDCRNRYRDLSLIASGGDMDALKDATYDSIRFESELASFVEACDFANINGWLDEKQLDAVNNALAWAAMVVPR